MSDIVERLRVHARTGDGWTRPDAAEAADEIERLRAERDEASGLLVGPKQGRAIGALIEGARREEREACATVADKTSWRCPNPGCTNIAAAIRARGDA